MWCFFERFLCEFFSRLICVLWGGKMHKIRAHPRTKLSLQSRPHLGRSELQPLRFHNNNDDDDGFSLASSFLSLSSSSSSSSSAYSFPLFVFEEERKKVSSLFFWCNFSSSSVWPFVVFPLKKSERFTSRGSVFLTTKTETTKRAPRRSTVVIIITLWICDLFSRAFRGLTRRFAPWKRRTDSWISF